jgi:hypothetical protein
MRRLLDETHNYLLPFSHTAQSYRVPKRVSDPEADAKYREGYKESESAYQSKQEALQKKRRWFFRNNIGLISARRYKFAMEILFPFITGIVAILVAAWKLHARTT